MQDQSPQDRRQLVTREFLDSLTRVSRKVRTVFNARVIEHGLTYARARALLRLLLRSGQSQRELACDLELEQATMGRMLDRMEELDLIARVPDPNDRRAKLIVLTAHGEAQARLVEGIGRDIRAELFGEIPTEEIRRMVGLLDRLEMQIGERTEPQEDASP